MEGSRFGMWTNDLTTFFPTSDPPQIVVTGGSRQLPSVMFVIRCPVRIDRRDRPAPRVGTFSGAARCHNFWPHTRSGEYREAVSPRAKAAPLEATLLQLLELLELLLYRSPFRANGSNCSGPGIDNKSRSWVRLPRCGPKIMEPDPDSARQRFKHVAETPPQDGR